MKKNVELVQLADNNMPLSLDHHQTRDPATAPALADSDVWHSFRSSPTAMIAALIAFVCLFCAIFANLIAPHNPFDLATSNSPTRACRPHGPGGIPEYLLGTDDQGAISCPR